MNEPNVFYTFVLSLLEPFENIMTDYEYHAALFALTILVASLCICGFVSALFGCINALLAMKRK